MKELLFIHSQLEKAPARWRLLRMLCALLWAAELFWVQSLPFQEPPWVRFPLLTQLIRFGFDLLLTVGMTFLIRRRVLTVVMVAGAMVSIIVATYADHFHWPFMPARILSQWEDGWKLRSSLSSMISMELIAVFAGLFAVKVFLLVRSGYHELHRKAWLKLGMLLLSLYIMMGSALQFTHLRLSIGPNGGFGRGVFIYGYSIPWALDYMANSSVEEHSARAQDYLSHHYDRITPIENDFPVGNNLLVLQMESVDGRAIGSQYLGKDIMPFAKALRKSSFVFRIHAFHRNGSCDMDYAATTGVEPYPGMVPYKLHGMHYTNSIPGFMKQHGFTTYFFHGNTAIFYDRGPVISELGFDHIQFKEELADRDLPMTAIGVRDVAVLQCMTDVFRTNSHAYVFGITLDTHGPYQQLSQNEMEIFPQPKQPVERYLNSLRYFDNCLRKLVENLPDGTTLVIYGDHTASFDTQIFRSDLVEGQEYVDCLIFKKGADVSSRQETRGKSIATEGTLNLLDVLNYLRSSIAATNCCPPMSFDSHKVEGSK